MRRVRATIVVVEKQKVLHIVCVFVALGTQHAPYYHLCSVLLYNIFPHYFKKRHDFRKNY